MKKKFLLTAALLAAFAFPIFGQLSAKQVPFIGRYSSDPVCSRVGNIYLNTATNDYKKCTATGNPGTWTVLGAAPDETAQISSVFEFGSAPSGVDTNGWVGSASVSQMWGFVTPSDLTGFNAVSLLSINLRTTASASMYLFYGREVSTTTKGSALRFGVGATEFTAKFSVATASDATNTYTIRSGFLDTTNAESTNGCFFRYTHSVNSGNWQAVCRSGGVETATDTGVAGASSSLKKFKVAVNAAGTSVVFSIDGVTVATLTTNIPTAANKLMSAGWNLIKTAGTSETQVGWMDYCKFVFTFTTAR